MIGGTHGKLLHVDLTAGRIQVESLPDEVYRLLAGGRALVAYLLWRAGHHLGGLGFRWRMGDIWRGCALAALIGLPGLAFYLVAVAAAARDLGAAVCVDLCQWCCQRADAMAESYSGDISGLDGDREQPRGRVDGRFSPRPESRGIRPSPLGSGLRAESGDEPGQAQSKRGEASHGRNSVGVPSGSPAPLAGNNSGNAADGNR